MGLNMDRYRKRIDRIDRRVARLLEKRLGQVLLIGIEKKKNGIDVSDAERETEVLRNVSTAVKDERAGRFVQSIYGRIFEVSSRAQKEENWTGK
ncbi:MAG: chorismate mutase [Spirochaetes bacterium]|nr:chorismate mutase [Spirochaetota bacterium]